MNKDVVDPFNEDMLELGGYKYTRSDKPSAIYTGEKITRIILENIDFTGKQVVDIGCGDGTYTKALFERTRARSILGIDPAYHAISSARKQVKNDVAGLDFECCVTRDLLERNQHFDIAICRGVLHHVVDPKAELARVINVADTVYIVEPNGLNVMLKMIERLSAYHRRHGERSYPMRYYKRWIVESGGEVVKTMYHDLVPVFCPNVILKMGRLLEPLIEPLPFMNQFLCGRMFIAVKKK